MRRRIGWRDLFDAAAAAVRLAAVEIGLRMRPVPDVAQRAGAPLDLTPAVAPTNGATALSEAESRKLVAVRWVARRLPFDDTCLRRSLAMGHVLRSRGPRLRIGVRRLDGRVLAHAWLELDDGVLGVEPDHTFAVLHRPVADV